MLWLWQMLLLLLSTCIAKMQSNKLRDQMSSLIYSPFIESIIQEFPQERVAKKVIKMECEHSAEDNTFPSQWRVSDLHLLAKLLDALHAQRGNIRCARDTQGHGEINGQLWCFKMLKVLHCRSTLRKKMNSQSINLSIINQHKDF